MVDSTTLAPGCTRPAAPAGLLAPIDAAHRRSIRLHVERHLGDPALTPSSVAAAHALSLRYVHRLWAQEAADTLGRHILRRRLERCRADLADPRQAGRTVTDIALRWGFRSPAHFSRAYRAHFGAAPREHRQAALGQDGPALPA